MCFTVFARNWSAADPNFAPFIRPIWLALSEFLCLLANQNVMFVTLFCTKLPFFSTQLPFFCTVLPKNYISLSQLQSRNFFMYIITVYYKVRWAVVTNCDNFFITKCDTFYYRLRQVLQSAMIFTNCDRYYKVRWLLQIATVQTVEDKICYKFLP